MRHKIERLRVPDKAVTEPLALCT